MYKSKHRFSCGLYLRKTVDEPFSEEPTKHRNTVFIWSAVKKLVIFSNHFTEEIT